ncbi:MAG: site-specific DNA-methyltransferase [Phycisphaerae bacterium]|nr:MAG: site-specific DNA-methyltransferase [Planctomycetota bacterium]KAB2948779.1 MAG: site-specific DNA-methyltransferase [Phycisphaerae bacterium]MBE7457724.1 site-specific DNA-methyltransferase [Planctomycetia bacterium]MCK6463756.1 site-specific DNA-methyltransferase [Phycisphaerae bacterium]MCL4717528.1 site-specific DNA-methyltransferase [Phycisphaerae bacterium]
MKRRSREMPGGGPRPAGARRRRGSAEERTSAFTSVDALLGRVHLGDNLDLMRRLPDGCCQLVYADPPFASGRARVGRDANGATMRFSDGFPGGTPGWITFLKPRLIEMRRLLSPDGSLYLHLDPRVAAYARVELDRIFGEENFLNEIVWCYRTGSRPGRHFPRKHDTILLYAQQRGKQVFNVVRDGEYRTQGLRRDGNGRPFKRTRRGPLYFHADGPALTDVWDVPFLSTVSAERTGYPTQKPLRLLELMIRTSTNRGAVVADFFCGSGTTLAAAQRLGRRWIGCDVCEAAVAVARRRLALGSEPDPPGPNDPPVGLGDRTAPMSQGAWAGDGL